MCFVSSLQFLRLTQVLSGCLSLPPGFCTKRFRALGTGLIFFLSDPAPLFSFLERGEQADFASTQTCLSNEVIIGVRSTPSVLMFFFFPLSQGGKTGARCSQPGAWPGPDGGGFFSFSLSPLMATRFLSSC